MPITSIEADGRKIELARIGAEADDNVFSFIIGRNGTGKSRLLRSICGMVLRLSSAKHGYDLRPLLSTRTEHSDKDLWFGERGSLAIARGGGHHEYLFVSPEPLPQAYLSSLTEQQRQQVIDAWQRDRALYQLSASAHGTSVAQEQWLLPTRTIVVSASPFDKFPRVDTRYFSRLQMAGILSNVPYFYRGARTASHEFDGYLEGKLEQLGASFADFFLKPEARTRELQPLFDFLGFAENFRVHLSTPLFFSPDEVLNSRGRGVQAVVNSVQFHKHAGEERALAPEEQSQIRNAVYAVFSPSDAESPRRPGATFSFDLDLHQKFPRPDLLRHIAFLASYGLVQLDEVEFKKRGSERPCLLREASSGELCVLFNVLSIASLIEDYSLVLIDEPELSLHPEWQVRLIRLVYEIFSSYKGCHFIVATHSSQVLSSMPAAASFVVNLESEVPAAASGEHYANMSADRLLSSAFHSPGHRNEYLNRLALNVFSRFSKSRAFDESMRCDVELLIAVLPTLPGEDPVRELVSSVVELFSAYG